MRHRIILGATLAAIFVTTEARAQIQPISGVYIGAGIGGTMLNETINRRSPTGFFGQGNGSQFSYKPGFVGQGAVGWAFGNGIRAEMEGYVRRPGLDNVTLFGNGSFSGGLVSRQGSVQIYGFMANAYYDFDLTSLGSFFRWVQPYVGIGVGLAYSEYRNISVDAFGSLRTNIGGSASTVGYQGIVGAAVPMDYVTPGLAFTAEYRYFGAGAPRLSVTTSTIPTNNQPPFTLTNLNRSVSPGIGSHNFTVGFRYAFNTPQDVPAAAPVALGYAVPQFASQPRSANFAVFFPLSNANLDTPARGTVAEAARTARNAGASVLDVVGSADGADNASNRSLAARRAQAVVAELVRQGIPRNAISVSSTGGAGPQDPQSRRVDITLR